jgi:hypothetical protein
MSLPINTINQVNSLTHDMSTEDLRELYNIILFKTKESIKLDNKNARYTLSIGDNVSWTNSKTGTMRTGKIQKINITKAIVIEDGSYTSWTIPMVMLKTI